jgi:hypothetical protein
VAKKETTRKNQTVITPIAESLQWLMAHGVMVTI